ncbi:MAG: ABC transporter permease [Bacteroidota bacterium]
MFQNYIKIAFRTFSKHKAYTGINVLGLTLSLACGLMMLLWVQDEYAQDRNYQSSEQIFRLWRNFPNDKGQLQTREATPYPVAETLVKDFPEIESAAAFRGLGEVTLKKGGETLVAEGAMAHFSWFDIFTIPLLQGTLEGATDKLDGIFISQNLAEKYFGTAWENGVVGQTIGVDGRDVGTGELQVLGVYENIPAFARFDFDFMTNVKRFAKDHPNWTSWGGSAFWTYYKINASTNPTEIQSKIADLVPQNGGQKNLSLYAQNIGDSYLYAQFENGVPTGGRITYVRIFFFASLFLILMACINFVNLATVQATRRASEVGVRKVIGAGKQSLFMQFMSEATLITLVSVVLAVLLCEGLLPYTNNLLGKTMNLDLLNGQVLMTLALILGTVSLLAGAYPAFMLSSFPITNILKNKLGSNFSSNTLRKGLVIAQFGLSALVLTSSLIIQQQVNFIQDRNMGMDREQIIQMQVPNQLRGKTHEFKASLLNNPAITQVSQIQSSPINVGRATDDFSWAGKDPELETRIQYINADNDLLKTFKMEMLSGTFHQKEAIDTFTDKVVFNEKAIALMGLEDPISQRVTLGDFALTIIGVVKDFHANSLHEEIQPLAIFNDTEAPRALSIRYEKDKVTPALAHLEKTYGQFVTDSPMQFHFLDDLYDRMYQSELLIGKLANFFAFIAVFISCLGLLGLISFMADQRTKEIGIRKVLGASVFSIVGLLSRDLLKLIVLAFLIAVPFTYYFTQDWLQNFAYRVDVQWWIFVVAGFGTVLIALTTLSVQSVRAAVANPIESLKND